MLKKISRSILFVVVLLWGINASAEHPYVNISVGLTRSIGDTTYKIGNIPASEDYWGRDPYFPISELVFPLNVYLGSLDIGFEKDKWSLTIGAKKNITQDETVMTDSDWGVPWWDSSVQTWYVWTYEGSSEQLLDIYSESESELDALVMNARLRYNFYKVAYDSKSDEGEFLLYAGIRYIYQKFSFKTRLIQQWDLREGRVDVGGQAIDIPDESNMDYTGNGDVTITYDTTYHIPFLELSMAERLGKVSGTMSLGFAPYVRANDSDVHLARIPGPIYADGECTGKAYLFSLDWRYEPFKHWFATFQFSYMSIDTDGEQDNHFYAGSYNDLTWPTFSWTTDEEIISSQQNYSITIGYTF